MTPPRTRRIVRRRSTPPPALAFALALATPVCSLLLLAGFSWWRATNATPESIQPLLTVAAPLAAPATMTAVPVAAAPLPTNFAPSATITIIAAQPSATEAPPGATATATAARSVTPIALSTSATALTSVTGTITATSSPTLSPEVSPTPTMTAASATATLTVTPSAAASGVWSFSGVQSYYSAEDEAYRVFGEAINNTGAAQEIETITGQFFNAQGQVIAGDADTAAAFPVSLIPHGRSVPFDLYVDGIQSADRIELLVVAMPSPATLRSDFILSGLNAAMENTSYCVRATLQNPGPRPQSSVTLVVVIYDPQSRVINYGYGLRPASAVPENSSTEVKVCVPEPNANVAAQTMTAWGR
jgi:hypothetical protein